MGFWNFFKKNEPPKPQYLIDNPAIKFEDVSDLIKENKIDPTTALKILIYFKGDEDINNKLRFFGITSDTLLKLDDKVINAFNMRYIYIVTNDVSKIETNGPLYGPNLDTAIKTEMERLNLIKTEMKGGKSKQRRKKNKNKNKKTKKRN
jgi:hypothetical protein